MPLSKQEINNFLNNLTDDCSLEDIMLCLDKIEGIEKKLFQEHENEVFIPLEIKKNLEQDLNN